MKSTANGEAPRERADSVHGTDFAEALLLAMILAISLLLLVKYESPDLREWRRSLIDHTATCRLRSELLDLLCQ
jgi:hypothetical protein